MVCWPEQGLQEQQSPRAPHQTALCPALSSQHQQRGIAENGAWFLTVASEYIISSAVKISITEAPLKDAQCMLVSGQSKIYLCTRVSSHLGCSPVLFGALVELFPQAAG